ncbi:MAG: SEC-C metal-binding domain-containing protein [Acidimicrobiales bacterium]
MALIGRAVVQSRGVGCTRATPDGDRPVAPASPGRQSSTARTPSFATIGVTTSKEAVMAKVGRNEPCPCGSEKEAKRCCFSPQKLADDGAARRILRQLGSSATRPLTISRAWTATGSASSTATWSTCPSSTSPSRSVSRGSRHRRSSG